MRNRSSLFFLVVLAACTSASLPIPKNQYGLEIVPDVATYRRLVRTDPEKELVDIQRFIPSIEIDVRYATTNNFMHRQLYPVARVYLRRPAALALRAVQSELAADHLGLAVFDGYRPYRITEAMWEPYKNPDFVADPGKGSRHNRGAAVDLTLIDLATRRELAMPTPYDDFTSRARQDFADLPPEVAANRGRLRDAMMRHGFEPLPTEWWHFDFHGWQRYELMDIGLDELGR
jgi:D-alanyl-D-alanine dipeptidase